jgi:branched-chain amino acid transport system permease protein
MEFSWDLTINAVLSGILLGGFYAAVAVGITIAFGMLDIVNIAHPAFIVLGAFIAYYLNATYGIDPLLAAALAAPVAYLAGRALYRVYYYSFERRGEESLQGLAFFFGLLFIVEVSLLLQFGVDYRTVEAPYIGPTLALVAGFSVPLRLLTPLTVGLGMVLAIHLFLSRTSSAARSWRFRRTPARCGLSAATPSASRRSPSASPLRPPSSPGRCSSSSSRSSHRSAASSSAGFLPSACWAA